MVNSIRKDEALADIENDPSSKTINQLDNASNKINQEKIAQELEAKHKSELNRTNLQGLRSFYGLRKIWSWFILSCIAVLIAFQILITVFIGMGYLSRLKEYGWFLPLVITENFIQIIGLAIIVVKFLFDDHKYEK